MSETRLCSPGHFRAGIRPVVAGGWSGWRLSFGLISNLYSFVDAIVALPRVVLQQGIAFHNNGGSAMAEQPEWPPAAKAA
jgi:hypothetical protein